MGTKGRLKCRWCDWSTASFYTDSRGSPRSGWSKLMVHQEASHPAEAEELQEALDRACGADQDD